MKPVKRPFFDLSGISPVVCRPQIYSDCFNLYGLKAARKSVLLGLIECTSKTPDNKYDEILKQEVEKRTEEY